MLQYMCRSFEPRGTEGVQAGWSVLDLDQTQLWLNGIARGGWRLVQVICLPERRPDDRDLGDEGQLVYYFEREVQQP